MAAEQTPQHETSAIPTSVFSFGMKVITESLKGAQDPRVKDFGERLDNLHKVLGRLGSRLLDKFFKTRGTLTDRDLEEIVEELKGLPESQINSVAGEILIDKITSPVGNDLDSYATATEVVCEVMRGLKSSIALRGFLHGPECISYWHYKGDPRVQARESKAILELSGFEIYLIWVDPKEEDLTTLNEMIRDSDDHRLPSDLYDHRKNRGIGRISSIKRARLTVEELPAQGNALFDSYPNEVVYEIPPGAPGLLVMVESLFRAKDIMNERQKRLAETMEAIRKRIGIPKPDLA